MREAFLSSASESTPSPAASAVEHDTTDGAFARKEAEDARDRAEAASEAKSRLLATMSHEIRTPLNGIMGFADLLAATELEPEQRAYIEAIRSSGKSLVALVNEILDLSKLEAGKITLNEAPFDIALLVEGVIEILAPRAHAKGLDIASFMGADVPATVIGDAARLRQVLLNLAGNAVKFTEHGGLGLRVTCAHDSIKFAVTDTGPGIAAEDAELIFEEFTQTTPPEASGAGLGLSISRRLAERMGGKLELETTLAHGATFALTLPLAAVNGPPASTRIERRLLVVSPSPFEAPYLVEKLVELGAEALRAPTLKSGLAAIDQAVLAEMPPDTLIIDCVLGSEAIAQLQTAADAAGIAQKLVLFTAAERRGFGPQAMRVFDGWLVKPLRLRSLLARIGTDAPHSAPPQESPTPADLSGSRILLAEDNDINALILQKHLEKCGATLSRVSDGLAALACVQDALAATPFEAIILDLRMPGLDGLTLAREIRHLEAAALATPTRLIAVSADAFAETKRVALAAGVDAFLTKPVDFVALDAALTTPRKISR
ncbi:MAG: ATP-binding protein [Methylovirgula sp.]|uniref:ATP-binding protein n=1 Tax=Methylovirgula sp. TaxID=1978224 RepID=UPI0030766741